jgi:hypothetical protein
MGFDSEWALAGCMKGGTGGGIYPVGYLSEKRPCPHCAKPVAGRSVGMVEHMRAKHGMSRGEAQAAIYEAGTQWSSEEEIRAAQVRP